MIIKDTRQELKDMIYKGHMVKRDQNSDRDRALRKTDPEKEKHLTGIFASNPSFVYAYKKTERLITAVYMVTDILSDYDPLKNNVRESSLGLLSAILLLKDEPTSQRAFKEIYESVIHTVSMLDISFSTGKISEMNASVLKREFHALLEHITSFFEGGDSAIEGGALKSSFFEVEMPKDNRSDEGVRDHRPSSENRFHSSQTASPSFGTPASFSGEQGPKDRPRKTHGRPSGYVGNVAKNERRAAIFNLLREKKEITVRDLANVVTDCSEKTLQRELLQLVDEGILNKEGERRWSRYSLVV